MFNLKEYCLFLIKNFTHFNFFIIERDHILLFVFSTTAIIAFKNKDKSLLNRIKTSTLTVRKVRVMKKTKT